MIFEKEMSIKFTQEEREILEKAYYVLVNIQDIFESTQTDLLTNDMGDLDNEELDFILERLNLLFLDTKWQVE